MKGKKIIVWGLGRSGEAAAEFCLQAGARVLLVDQKRGARLDKLLEANLAGADFCRQDQLDLNREVDEIVLSPGIPRSLPALRPFLARHVPVINEVELAYCRWRRESKGPIVAVTGSNGKTTTVHMMDQFLRSHGQSVFLGGNVGVPFCEYFNKKHRGELAVLELSSFQLESLFDFEADVRVILNLNYTHAERYSSLEDYARAKLRLANNSRPKDLFICGLFESDILKNERSKLSSSFDWREIPRAHEVRQQLESKYDLTPFRPVGDHNLSNLWVAIKACEFLGHSNIEATQKFLGNFEGPEHRLEPLYKDEKRWILNDSKSTNWTSTLAALKACQSAPRPLALILGGKKRGENDSIRPYLDVVTDSVDQIFLIGESGQDIYRELLAINDESLNFVYYTDLKQMVLSLSKCSKNRGLIFSPAFPSFDQYENYEQRGLDFKRLVQKYLMD